MQVLRSFTPLVWHGAASFLSQATTLFSKNYLHVVKASLICSLIQILFTLNVGDHSQTPLHVCFILLSLSKQQLLERCCDSYGRNRTNFNLRCNCHLHHHWLQSYREIWQLYQWVSINFIPVSSVNLPKHQREVLLYSECNISGQKALWRGPVFLNLGVATYTGLPRIQMGSTEICCNW